ncbi:hypothetical protein TrVE_jg8590 [Triparma verrucosa]|uniref:V-SNARE coiled-coil homology domain-containing protein n=1 Tax=Triparma verrucosa TaxID=1606542 RepID=A0A9W7FG52_9STRA|nr:hypothetical protein TrVE_jg8590 [Triparma verrucosa]
MFNNDDSISSIDMQIADILTTTDRSSPASSPNTSIDYKISAILSSQTLESEPPPSPIPRVIAPVEEVEEVAVKNAPKTEPPSPPKVESKSKEAPAGTRYTLSPGPSLGLSLTLSPPFILLVSTSDPVSKLINPSTISPGILTCVEGLGPLSNCTEQSWKDVINLLSSRTADVDIYVDSSVMPVPKIEKVKVEVDLTADTPMKNLPTSSPKAPSPPPPQDPQAAELQCLNLSKPLAFSSSLPPSTSPFPPASWSTPSSSPARIPLSVHPCLLVTLGGLNKKKHFIAIYPDFLLAYDPEGKVTINCYWNLLKMSLKDPPGFILTTAWSELNFECVPSPTSVSSALSRPPPPPPLTLPQVITSKILTANNLTWPTLPLSSDLKDPKLNTAIQIHTLISSKFTKSLNGSPPVQAGDDGMGWNTQHWSSLRVFGKGEFRLTGEDIWGGSISVVDVILRYGRVEDLKAVLEGGVEKKRGDELEVCLKVGEGAWEECAEILWEKGFRFEDKLVNDLNGRKLEWALERCGYLGGGFSEDIIKKLEEGGEQEWEDLSPPLALMMSLLNKGVSGNAPPLPLPILQNSLPGSQPAIELLLRNGTRCEKKDYPQIYAALGSDKIEALKKEWKEERVVSWPNGYRISDERRKSIPEASTCSICASSFSLLNRKFLCNYSQTWVCSSCSEKKVTGVMETVRVSDPSYLYLKYTDNLRVKERERKVLQEIAEEEAALKTTTRRTSKGKEPENANRAELFGKGIMNAVKGVGDFFNVEEGLEPSTSKTNETQKNAGKALGAVSQARDRLNERGEKLRDLGEKSERLNNQSRQFEEMARELNKNSKSWF